MSSSKPSDSEIVRSLLEPLLDDFQYWFDRAKVMLEHDRVEFLTVEQQADLLEQVSKAQQEVQATQSLVLATDGQVGVEASILVPWHRLVAECWKVGMKHRMSQRSDSSTLEE